MFVGAVFDERVDQLCFDKVIGPEASKDMSDLTIEVGLQPPEDGQAGYQDGIAVAPLSGHLAKFNRVINTAKPDNVATDSWVPSLFYL